MHQISSTSQETITANEIAFHAVARFPNIFGAIDCTHIQIKAPSVNEESFVNRKGIHTINVQVSDISVSKINSVSITVLCVRPIGSFKFLLYFYFGKHFRFSFSFQIIFISVSVSIFISISAFSVLDTESMALIL